MPCSWASLAKYHATKDLERLFTSHISWDCEAGPWDTGDRHSESVSSSFSLLPRRTGPWCLPWSIGIMKGGKEPLTGWHSPPAPSAHRPTRPINIFTVGRWTEFSTWRWLLGEFQPAVYHSMCDFCNNFITLSIRTSAVWWPAGTLCELGVGVFAANLSLLLPLFILDVDECWH